MKNNLKQIGTELFHNVLNPAHAPLKSANSRTLGTIFSSGMGRADIEVPDHAIDRDSKAW